MASSDRPNYQDWLARGIAGFCVVFIGWFIITEANGLWQFVRFISEAIYSIPGFLSALGDYYGSLSYEQIVPSILLGGFLGSVLTASVYANGVSRVSADDSTISRNYLIAVLMVIGLLILGVGIWLTLLGGVITILLIIVGSPSDAKRIRNVFHANKVGFTSAVMGGGLGGGVVGAQLLLYPTQHCTFSPEATGSEYRIGIILALLGVVIVLLPLWSILGRRTQLDNQSTAGYFKGYSVPFAYLFPTLAILLVFLYYPAVEIASKSLTQSNARLPGRGVFVCLQNYTELPGDATYISSLMATFFITLAIVIFALAVSLGIAILASQKVRGAYFYRTLLIWPYALSPVVAGAIFFTMFQQDSGFINSILETLIGKQLKWFTEPTLARLMIIFASVWNILGFNILFYVAGLQTIPTDLLESAAIDGANRFRRFIHITFPLLTPFTFFLLVTNITYSFYGIFGVVDILTQGGPRLGEGGASGATEVLIYRLYNGSSQAGSAAAQALILFVMIAAITVLQFGTIERRVTYSD